MRLFPRTLHTRARERSLEKRRVFLHCCTGPVGLVGALTISSRNTGVLREHLLILAKLCSGIPAIGPLDGRALARKAEGHV